MLNLATARFSPLTAVLQHYASLMQGLTGLIEVPRLRLVWQLHGSASLEQWPLHDDPVHASLLIRLILVGSSFVSRRIASVFGDECAPWSQLAVADQRLPFPERVALARRFKGKLSCCIQPGFARKLHTSDLDLAEVRGKLSCGTLLRL